MLVIGLTGGIGSGKTTVANMFADLDVPVIDTDQISRQLTEKNEAGYAAVVTHFGINILDQDRSIDRAKLRTLVFSDNSKRKELESLLHPIIKEQVLERIRQIGSQPYCLVVVPLLFETDYHELVDRSLVVDTPENIQLDRVMHRDNMTEQEARNILKAQTSRQQRNERADDTISNDCSIEELAEKVRQLHRRYIQLSETKD